MAADEQALAKAIERWGGTAPETLRGTGEKWGLDPVIWKWAMDGEATQGQVQEIRDELHRLYPGLASG